MDENAEASVRSGDARLRVVMNGTPTQMQPSVAAEASSGEAFEPATVARRSRFISYRSYLLVLLILIHAIVLTERFALSISLQSIKRDMGLSDTLLGLMSGLAFTVFYAAMGIPIGLWADRGSRVKVVSVTMFIWGVMVALCGAVGNFVQLLLVRVGVAIGEAGGLTPSYSLISEHFGRAERPRALGLFALGAPISLLISFLAAGWLNQTYGWRTMFVVIASPGVVLAILAAATLRDPRSSKSQTSAQPLRNDTAPSVLDVVAYLGRNRTFRRMVLATSLNFFFLYALFQWQPTFFGRSFGMTSLQIGTAFGLIGSISGLLGTSLGGAIATRYAANNEAWQLRGAAVTVSITMLLCFGIYLSHVKELSFALLAGVLFGQTMINGPLSSTVQTLVPPRMRAVAMATMFFFANLIGMGLGPLIVGALSDALHPYAGAESLRYALMIACPSGLLTAASLWAASATIGRDMQNVE